MFRALLRLLPEYRALENDLAVVREAMQSGIQERLRLEDRLEAALADRTKLWDLMTKSIEEMRIAYQMHVNQAWQRQGGGVPYPDAPHLPTRQPVTEPNNDPVGRRGRILPSELVAQQARDFVTGYFTKPQN